MSRPADYHGMCWLKCDLHVHTPEDARHWADSEARLSSPRSEQDLREKARLFLARCHEICLECISVTDHNFSAETDPRKWFLTHLIEQNRTVAESVGRAPLVIFPGFELDIRYHVLCLFNPVSKAGRLQGVLSGLLTNMGLPPNARFANSVPQQPKHVDRCWSLREVLKIVQTDLSGIVIAGHAFSNDGICNDTANIPEFVGSPDLYAVEVSAWPPSGKAASILNGSNTDWNRSAPYQQPAAVCSSDAKSLKGEKGANSLGCRFSWIKMSAPSCEALRQAFLDPDSRICLQAEPPVVTHAHIRRISVNGTKFLADQTLTLSPHLNCIIGGRGSGKSMLFESMRLGLRRETRARDSDEEDDVAAKQVKRLRGTSTDSSRIQLDVVHGGIEDRFILDDLEQPAYINGREVEDPPTVFRQINAVIFSQEEITELADRQRSLLDFIDSLAGGRLEPHRLEATSIVERLKAARQVEQTLKRLDGELITLKQEAAELSLQLEAKTQVQKELKRHQAAQEAQRYLDSLSSKAEEIERRILGLAEELESELSLPAWETEEEVESPNEPPPPDAPLDQFPEKAFLAEVEEKMNAAYWALAGSLRSAAASFRESADLALSKHPDWKRVQGAIQKAEEVFKVACDERGLTPAEAEQLRGTELQHRTKQKALERRQAERNEAEKKRPDMSGLLAELVACWRQETRIRQAILDEIRSSDTIPRTENDEPIVCASLYMASKIMQHPDSRYPVFMRLPVLIMLF